MGDMLFKPSEPERRQRSGEAQNFQYTAPNLQNQYSQFRDTGQVPYSYYGQAPTNQNELTAVRNYYPSSFTENVTETPATYGNAITARSQSPFSRLFSALGNR